MKIVVIVLRVLMGLLFVFAGGAGLLHKMPAPQLTGDAKAFMDGVTAAHYFLPLLQITQLVCGLLLVIGLFVPLALVMIFPVVLNILLYHIYVDPKGLPLAIPLFLVNLFLAFHYRKNYYGLLAAK